MRPCLLSGCPAAAAEVSKLKKKKERKEKGRPLAPTVISLGSSHRSGQTHSVMRCHGDRLRAVLSTTAVPFINTSAELTARLLD